jgi:hypothetical protein
VTTGAIFLVYEKRHLGSSKISSVMCIYRLKRGTVEDSTR